MTFDSVSESVYEWLPLIGRLYPGITPFNVWQLTLRWWETYLEVAQAHVEASKKRAEEARRGRK